jgi:hypothetical protein
LEKFFIFLFFVFGERGTGKREEGMGKREWGRDNPV